MALMSLSSVTFFVDSGAGKSLCSVGIAFSDLQPCRVRVTGVAGSLPIYGSGTASFIAKDHTGRSIIIVIPNRLFGRCAFNLLSVSQLNQVQDNRVDFSLDSPALVLAPPPGIVRPSARVPLTLDDGLFALQMEPLTEGDARWETLPKYVVMMKGTFVPSDPGEPVRWKANFLTTTTSTARLLAFSSDDCHEHLETFFRRISRFSFASTS